MRLVSTPIALLALAVALSGCQTSLWTPYPGPAQPTAQAPAGPAVAVALTTLQVEVQNGGKALSGYALEVKDAVTGAVIPTMAQAPTDGSTALVAGSPVVTDAEGKAKLMLSGLTKGRVLKVSATGNGQMFEGLHLVGYTKKAGYTVAQAEHEVSAAEAGETAQLVIDINSTVGARMLEGLARASKMLSDGARGTLMGEALEQFQAIQAALDIKIEQNPDLSARIVIAPIDGGALQNAASALTALLNLAGFEDEFSNFIADQVENIANEAKKENRTDKTYNDRVTFPGTNLVADIRNDGQKVMLVNVLTGNEVDAGQEEANPVIDPGAEYEEKPEPPTTATVTIRAKQPITK